jgi:hypothetical protein
VATPTIHKRLESIRDTEDVGVVLSVFRGSNTCNNENACGNENLTANQESLQVLPREGELRVGVGNRTSAELLHTLRNTDNTAKQNPRMATDMMTRAQKNRFWAALRGGLLESMGLPVILENSIWTRYTQWRRPEK